MAYSENEARELVIKAGLRLLESGLIARTWGNISARISDTEFIITPSGRAYDSLRPEDLVRVKIADCSYEGDIKPSSEKGIHADSYRLRNDVNFVIHTHQFYATAVGVTGENMTDPYVPCAAYGMPSTDKLRKAVSASVESNPGSRTFLMTRHGALCLGLDYEDAFRLASDLETAAERLYYSRVKKCDELVRISKLGRTLKPAIDDLAQIAGVTVRCVPADADSAAVAKALKGRNAVFIKGKGAVCSGEDKEAVEMILRKGCAAALYQKSLKGLPIIDRLIMRTVYVLKYSKRK